ncbi:PREDICTED: RNA-binding protein 34 [Tinamus guttatus]|uniref:RNA-binding protein 34 n=1 Tax=Tinamus guttatus TaxID=94827 RepID=UPI00052EE8C0|nr:PREDICTED: RNA-binding protein 34 [Tinamus guttatus]
MGDGAAAPPVLVAVPRENKKRKHTEEAEKKSEDHKSSTSQEPPVKLKKAKKKELSEAEKRLANRECALEQADEEEELKKFQSKEKQKTRTSRITTRNVVNSDTGITVKQKKRRNEAEETIKNRRTLFVGNLPVNCTAQMLKSLFKEYGQIESIRFRSVVPAEDTLSKKLAAIKRKVHPNMKYINAYVVFKEECDAIKALKKNGTEIASGFHIRVDLASENSSHDNKRSIFLGNLSYDISDDSVREHFADCGDIVAVRIVRDRQTGMGKGFGYILFENTDAVHLALKLNNSDLMGRKVRVKRCVEKGKAQQQNPNQSRGHKDKVDTPSKPKRYSSDSFVGEKATPLKKNTKTKRLRSITKKKTGKNK